VGADRVASTDVDASATAYSATMAANRVLAGAREYAHVLISQVPESLLLRIDYALLIVAFRCHVGFM